MRSAFALALGAVLCAVPTSAQPADRAISFPDVAGYQTLACDLHIHSVFSDGSVWPDIRVEEAVRDGLDAMAVTEHLEYQPHRHDIPHPDRNRAFEIATDEAEGHDLIVIAGSEITRSMPPGHANAIFIQDANRLLLDDPVAVYREAARQGGFTFWNHPNWTSQKPDGVAALTDLHRQLIDEGLLHGIEVANDVTYSDEALQIALDHDLTIIGTSDIHGLVDWQFEVPHGGHRPVTLVFAEERSAAGIKAGLEAGRTVVWYEQFLIGREDNVALLLDASVAVVGAQYGDDDSVLEVQLENRSDAALVLANRSAFTFHQGADLVTLPPHATSTLLVKTLARRATVALTFEVLNAVVAPNTHPTLTLEVAVGG